jgi:Flp pilus assembly protein TadG
VELALVAPILILLLMAVFQLAYVFETQIGLTNAVREAARRAAAAPNPTVGWVQTQLDGDGTPQNPGLLAANVQGYVPARANLPPSVSFCSYLVNSVTNYRVDVSVSYDHPVFFPLLSFMTGSAVNWNLKANAEMRLENNLAVDPGSCLP